MGKGGKNAVLNLRKFFCGCTGMPLTNFYYIQHALNLIKLNATGQNQAPKNFAGPTKTENCSHVNLSEKMI